MACPCGLPACHVSTSEAWVVHKDCLLSTDVKVPKLTVPFGKSLVLQSNASNAIRIETQQLHLDGSICIGCDEQNQTKSSHFVEILLGDPPELLRYESGTTVTAGDVVMPSPRLAGPLAAVVTSVVSLLLLFLVFLVCWCTLKTFFYSHDHRDREAPRATGGHDMPHEPGVASHLPMGRPSPPHLLGRVQLPRSPGKEVQNLPFKATDTRFP